MKKINEKQLDRIRGALYGVAVGDALGGPLEFMSDRQICDAYGRVTDMIGGGWLNLKPGEVTDDTQMTLCVARGILDALEAAVAARAAGEDEPFPRAERLAEIVDQHGILPEHLFRHGETLLVRCSVILILA